MFNKDNFIQYLHAASAAQEKLDLNGKSLFTCMCLMCKLKYNGNWKEYKKHYSSLVQRQVKVQGKIIDKSDYKCNLITSHTARRTFININIRRHKTSVEIRRATGHRTYFGYSKYLCYDSRA